MTAPDSNEVDQIQPHQHRGIGRADVLDLDEFGLRQAIAVAERAAGGAADVS